MPLKAAGSVTVTGGPIALSIAWQQVAYAVTFDEKGLPPGTNWTVTFNGVTRANTGEITFAAVSNGSYVYTVGSVTGYAANRTSGMVQVQGGSVSVPIGFQREGSTPANGLSSPTFLGLPAMEGYGVLGGVLIAILAVTAAVVLLRRRGGKTPPEPSETPSRSGAGAPPSSP
jgi:hypothetical protein